MSAALPSAVARLRSAPGPPLSSRASNSGESACRRGIVHGDQLEPLRAADGREPACAALAGHRQPRLRDIERPLVEPLARVRHQRHHRGARVRGPEPRDQELRRVVEREHHPVARLEAALLERAREAADRIGHLLHRQRPALVERREHGAGVALRARHEGVDEGRVLGRLAHAGLHFNRSVPDPTSPSTSSTAMPTDSAGSPSSGPRSTPSISAPDRGVGSAQAPVADREGRVRAARERPAHDREAEQLAAAAPGTASAPWRRSNARRSRAAGAGCGRRTGSVRRSAHRARARPRRPRRPCPAHDGAAAPSDPRSPGGRGTRTVAGSWALLPHHGHGIELRRAAGAGGHAPAGLHLGALGLAAESGTRTRRCAPRRSPRSGSRTSARPRGSRAARRRARSSPPPPARGPGRARRTRAPRRPSARWWRTARRSPRRRSRGAGRSRRPGDRPRAPPGAAWRRRCSRWLPSPMRSPMKIESDPPATPCTQTGLRARLANWASPSTSAQAPSETGHASSFLIGQASISEASTSSSVTSRCTWAYGLSVPLPAVLHGDRGEVLLGVAVQRHLADRLQGHHVDRVQTELLLEKWVPHRVQDRLRVVRLAGLLDADHSAERTQPEPTSSAPIWNAEPPTRRRCARAPSGDPPRSAA